MKGGTVIRLPDGRVGTICYNNLDGVGGVWGERDFSGVNQNFDDGWPRPEFMLREKDVEPLLREQGASWNHRPDLECVGTKYTVIKRPDSG